MSEQQEQAIDLETISLAELKNLANQESVDDETPLVEKPRDDKGRFVKPDEDTEEEDEPEQVVYRRVIDIGDGSGQEVFEAPTMEELLDKICTAKEHASKKIREQQIKLREVEQEQEQFSADDEFVISQELMSRPTDAIKKLFRKMTGYDITEFKSVAERSKALEASQAQQNETQRQEQASAAFMQAHPEYVANEANGKRLVREINSLIGEAKAAGREVDYSTVLEQAYTGLKNDGLIQTKSDDVQDLTVKAKPQPVTPTPAPRRASSLSGRAPVANQPRSTELTEADLYSMPLDELKALADKHARGL